MVSGKNIPRQNPPTEEMPELKPKRSLKFKKQKRRYDVSNKNHECLSVFPLNCCSNGWSLRTEGDSRLSPGSCTLYSSRHQTHRALRRSHNGPGRSHSCTRHRCVPACKASHTNRRWHTSRHLEGANTWHVRKVETQWRKLQRIKCATHSQDKSDDYRNVAIRKYCHCILLHKCSYHLNK